MDGGYDDIDDAIDAAVGMVDRRRFATELGIISVLRREIRRSELGWACLSQENIRRRAGLSRSTVQRHLGKEGTMWRTRWILERGPKAAGTRATFWRIRHPSQWRAVPWTLADKELRDYRLGFVSHDQDEAADEPQQPRQRIARQSRLAASPKNRAASMPSGPLAASPKNRAASPPSALQKEGEIARLDEPIDAPSPSSVGGADAPPPTREEEKEWIAAQQLIEAIEAKTGQAFISNPLKARTYRLLKNRTIEEWLAILPHAPQNLQLPKTVAWLEEIAGGRRRPPAARSVADSRQAELDAVRAKIAVYTQAGEDPPESLLERLQVCENATEAGEEPFA